VFRWADSSEARFFVWTLQGDKAETAHHSAKFLLGSQMPDIIALLVEVILGVRLRRSYIA
jgi:hypothetical protein